MPQPTPQKHHRVRKMSFGVTEIAQPKVPEELKVKV